MKAIKVLGICGSLRRQSRNMNLLRYAREHAPPGMQIEIADLSTLPFYNADISEKPAAVQILLSQIGQADALLLACPEYNYSIAPALKNALDWAQAGLCVS
jgi:chromate reductase